MAAFRSNFLHYFVQNNPFSRRIGSFPSVIDVIKKGITDKERNIKGWVRSVRKMKEIVFVDVNDGSCPESIQVVLPKERRPAGLTTGASVEARGPIFANSKGQLELRASDIRIIGAGYPAKYTFTPGQHHTHDYCRQHLPLRPRLPHFQALLRVRHRTLRAVHDWFDGQGFLAIDTPILTTNDCEGAGEVFKVLPVSQNLIGEMKQKGHSDADAFFGGPGFLSVSGQLHLEAITRSISKVYSISPTFRAENSKSRLHLSEFYMLEGEEAFIDSLDQVLNTVQSFLQQVILRIISACHNDLRVICHYDSLDFERHISKLERLTQTPFPRVTFQEACNIVEEHKEQFKSARCKDNGFTKEHELFLVEHFGQTPVFIVDWPARIKPFYMKTTPYNPELVSAIDLLVPNVGELCGGSLREDDPELLEQALSSQGDAMKSAMQWYLDLRKIGGVPTGGFGIGVERFIMLLTGLTNIKDTIPFPRWPHNLQM